MKHTTETTGRADPVYAMTLAMLDQIENVTAELHRERSAQNEAFRDFKDASDKERRDAIAEAESLRRQLQKAFDDIKIAGDNLHNQREEIERLKAELADTKSELIKAKGQLDAHYVLERMEPDLVAAAIENRDKAIAERDALRAYVERGRKLCGAIPRPPTGDFLGHFQSHRDAFVPILHWAAEPLPTATQPTAA